MHEARRSSSRPKPLTRACPWWQVVVVVADWQKQQPRAMCGIDAPALNASSLPRYKVTVGAGAPSVEPASALHGPQATAIDGRTDLTEVRRVEACGRQCPCTHVRVSEREVARFKILNQSERMRRRPTEVALHDGKSAERRLRDVLKLSDAASPMR